MSACVSAVHLMGSWGNACGRSNGNIDETAEEEEEEGVGGWLVAAAAAACGDGRRRVAQLIVAGPDSVYCIVYRCNILRI